jgi:hypothetical protein
MIMRRYLAIVATVIALLGTALAGIADAATAAKAPVPTCNPWGIGKTCTCPKGWYVKYPPLWEAWKWPTCVRHPVPWWDNL